MRVAATPPRCHRQATPRRHGGRASGSRQIPRHSRCSPSVRRQRNPKARQGSMWSAFRRGQGRRPDSRRMLSWRRGPPQGPPWQSLQHRRGHLRRSQYGWWRPRLPKDSRQQRRHWRRHGSQRKFPPGRNKPVPRRPCVSHRSRRRGGQRQQPNAPNASPRRGTSRANALRADAALQLSGRRRPPTKGPCALRWRGTRGNRPKPPTRTRAQARRPHNPPSPRTKPADCGARPLRASRRQAAKERIETYSGRTKEARRQIPMVTSCGGVVGAHPTEASRGPCINPRRS
mmetsp:Transcript_14341/g.39599  ORF Transcript_14341/g.39599 Transcript_14341/m.39599 type:complete len:287 (+) Transcript_14341:848-1708(+)